MKKYRLFMHGRNYLVDIDGSLGKQGFFQTLYIEAESAEHAADLAISSVHEGADLAATTKNVPRDPPSIAVEDITEMRSFFGLESMESRKIWYHEKKWWEFWKKGLEWGL